MRCILPLMNSNSIIPNHLQKSIQICWLTMTDHETALTFIELLLNHSSQLIASPEILSDVIEDCLEAFFSDRSDDEHGLIPPNNDVNWTMILPLIKLPNDKEKYRYNSLYLFKSAFNI